MIAFPSVRGIVGGMRGRSGILAAGVQTRRRVFAAIEWITRGYKVTKHRGISKGYSLLQGRWAPAYPETTAYTIPTLLNAGELLKLAEMRPMACSLADYLLDTATQEGGVTHFDARTGRSPIVFDTGQAILGWLAAFSASGEQKYLEAAARAGDWLTAVQHSSGSWGEYQHNGIEKVIDTRVAWSLLELDRHAHREAYIDSAIHNLEWALGHQDDAGWFRRCSLVRGEDPLTHTLAYTAEGLLECGRLLDEPKYWMAAQVTGDALLANQRRDGGLAATYSSAWRATSRSSCLTGNCQVARLWLQFFDISGEVAYQIAAEKAIKFVASTQNLLTSDSNVRGGIAGSFPIYGRYERFKYPNWAAKFFIDALLALEEAKNGKQALKYVG